MNHSKNSFVIAILSVAIITALTSVSMAQTSGAADGTEARKIFIKVGIIDIEAVRASSLAVKGIRKQITKYRTKIQEDIQKEEQELRKANNELTRQRTILAPEAFNAERAKFEKRLSSLQRRVQGSKQSMGRVQAEAVAKVDKAILEIIEKIIEEDGYTLILKKSSTIASARGLNLSDGILERLNKSLPSVKVSDPVK